MRCLGKLVDWNEDRGFGFIAAAGGEGKVFVHISSFGGRRRRPLVGDTVSYDLTRDGKGRDRAENVVFAGIAPKATAAVASRTTPRIAAGSSQRSRARPPVRAFPWTLVTAVILVASAGAGAFYWYTRQAAPLINAPRIGAYAQPTPTVAPKFHCEGKVYCAQMTSCEEAQFYLRNSPGTKMDGDGDGVPCESQWCSL